MIKINKIGISIGGLANIVRKILDYGEEDIPLSSKSWHEVNCEDKTYCCLIKINDGKSVRVKMYPAYEVLAMSAPQGRALYEKVRAMPNTTYMATVDVDEDRVYLGSAKMYCVPSKKNVVLKAKLSFEELEELF